MSELVPIRQTGINAELVHVPKKVDSMLDI